ncbi:hypothetical protein ACHAPT_005428 [Fusarium lateritium]
MTKDWEPVKEEIQRRYVLERKPLREVMRVVEGKYGFIASERSYRMQLKEWGYMKNRTQEFPKPNRRARPSNHSNQRPAAVLPNPGSFSIFQSGVPPSSKLDNGRDLYFTTPHLSSVEAAGPQLDSLGHEIQAPGISHLDQDAQDVQGMTQLHRAALNGDTDRVRLLLNAGASVDIQDHSGNTPLHCGVMANHCEIVHLILRFGADVDVQNHLGRAPLHLAISAHKLVEAFVGQDADFSIQDNKGDTPLHLALSASSYADMSLGYLIINVLLESGADVNRRNKAKVTPFLKLLDRSYSYEALKAIKSFLEAGASIHETLPDGRMPLRIFLSRAAETVFKDKKFILRCFLAKGASVLTPMPSGETLISAYCNQKPDPWDHWDHWSKDDANLGKELFRRITPDEVSKVGNSLLCELVDSHSERDEDFGELIATLLRHGANPNHQNDKGQTPLLLLFQQPKCKPPVIASASAPLLKHGANPWQRDFSGSCAFFEAAKLVPKGGIVKTMLEADLWRQQATHTSESGGSNTDAWDEWRKAARATDWGESKQLILREPRSPTDKVTGKLRDCALKVLAENHIRLAKDKFQGAATETELCRKYVARIFRDCKELGIVLNAACTDYLVELCL